MKKIIKNLLLAAIIILPLKANAATGIIDIYTSNKTPTIGSTFTITAYCKSSNVSIAACEYTLTYDSNKVKFISSSDNVSCNGTFCTYLPMSKSSSKTFTFKAISSGSTTISASSINLIDIDEKNISSSVSPTTINIKTNSSSSNNSGSSSSSSSSSSNNKVTYSTNNYLSSLKVDSYTLDPKFNKGKDKYSVTIDSSINKVKISATTEDSKAKVTGTGEKEVNEGINNFEIVVTSEKGTTRKYYLTINVTDENPIEVKINNQTYTIMKRLNTIEKPNSCTKSTVNINSIDIPSFTCENTSYTLIGLKDSTGNSNLYIYDQNNNTYSLYNEIAFNSVTIGILETDKTIDGYKKMNTTINGKNVIGYKTNNLSTYTLIYGINIENGKKGWYLYEESENTIQKFNEEEIKDINKKIDNCKLLIYAFAGTTLFLAFLLIVVATNNTKRNKRSRELKLNKSEINSEKISDDIKDTTKENKDTSLDKKENNKKKKKKKKDMFSDW